METIPIRQPLHVLKLLMACSATSACFYLPPRYETPILNISVSLDMATFKLLTSPLYTFTFGNTWEEITVKFSSNTL